jgi:small subunit ribosomal protein S17
MTDQQRKTLTTYKGVVASKSGDKTVRVTLEYQTTHPKYGKILRRRTKAHVHDEANVAQVGDTVEICKCRPLSKMKTWRLVQVVKTQ